MVLNDITNDYAKLGMLIEEHNQTSKYITSALAIITTYKAIIYELTDNFVKSSKRDQDRSNLIAGLSSLTNTFSSQLANMSSMRKTTLFVQQIEKTEFYSATVQVYAQQFCELLNTLMDITEEYLQNNINRTSNTNTFYSLLDTLSEFKNLYDTIYRNYKMLKEIENELLEELPFECTEDTTIYQLDIRSYKPETNLSSFSDDLKLISECLQNLERLVAPAASNSIYLRKIESGSLKAVFGSDKVDFSIFPDLITSISNAIKSWRMTPVEIEKAKAEAAKTNAETELLQAQAEEQRLKNEGTKLAIVKTEIDYVCEKLDLNPEQDSDKIEYFLYPLVSYIESNPIGIINGVSYDVSKEVRLLENKTELHQIS